MSVDRDRLVGARLDDAVDVPVLEAVEDGGVLGAGDALGEPLVVLLGSTAYYPRFGFRPASEYGITPKHPEWDEHFQVRPLTAYNPAVRGEFAYPEPFDRM